MPSSSPQPSTDALAIAALAAQGKTQTEIALVLGLSQSAVSRSLSVVQDYIVVERKFRWDKLSAAVAHEVRRKISHREISDRIADLARDYRQPAPTVHVVSMGESVDVAAQFDAFATPAAVELRDLLEIVRGRVGVAWGSVLWHTTQALRSILPLRPFREMSPIEFVPLSGDPLIDSREDYADRTSSRIVSELSKAANGDKIRPAWLGLVPAFIPRSFKPSEIRVIDRLIDLVKEYPRIFGPRMSDPDQTSIPMAGDLHMIITAAGTSKHPLGFGRNALLGLSDAESKQLPENIYGDIGGVLLPRPSEGRPHPLVADLTRRWTGLKLGHLKTCAERAFREDSKTRPGVVLLTFGASHVEIVLEAVRQGLVNKLIIGSDLEKALTESLRGGTPSAKHAGLKN